MMHLERSDDEINAELNRASELNDDGKNPFFGMTYIQGVEHAIRWLIGEEDESPLTE